MSLDLGLTNQPGWLVWYNLSDSPEGAYFGVVKETEDHINGTVQLGRTLQPGHYYVSWKVVDYSAGGTLDFSIGGSSVETSTLDSKDYNGQWTVPVAIDVPTAATTVSITLNRTKPLGVRQNFLVRGLYITTSATEAAFNNGWIVDLQVDPLDTSPPHKGNILENSGFEVGTGHGWGLDEETARDFTVASIWDTNVAYDGMASIRIPRFNHLDSRAYRLRGDREYTLSAWVKASTRGTVTLTFDGEIVLPLPTNLPPTVLISQTFATTSTWQRVSMSGILLKYPTGSYYIRISAADGQGLPTWVDDVQLEEGGLSDYAPAQNVEVGLVSSEPNNLFYDDEPVTMQLRVRNNGDAPSPVVVPYRIYDYLNREVGSGSTNVTAPAQGVWTGDVNLSTGLRGIFRVVLWVQDMDRTREELVYGVVPHPQQMGVDTNSIIGVHANFTDFQFAVLQKLGVKWNSTSSPSATFRWKLIEPTEGQFQWSSDDMTLATNHGLTVLGMLGPTWPAWAADSQNPSLPDLTKWQTFVSNVVDHYKTQVEYWEIWNEPQYTFTTNFYGELLKRAVAGIQSADPQAKIVGIAGSADATWSRGVLNYLGPAWVTNNLAGVSTHLYPLISLPSYKNWWSISTNFDIPVWNTEAGVWERGFYTGENSDFIQPDGYVWPIAASERYEFGHRGAPELLAYSFLHSVGNGLTKYFYYDARIAVGPASQPTHPTIFDYDDSIRSVGVAYAVLANLFDHSVGLGNISPTANSFMYLFNRSGTPLAGIWSTNDVERTLTVSLDPSSFRVYDLMGNPVTITNGIIPYNQTPVYIEGQGISVATLQAAIQSGVVATQADLTPPNLSLVVFPTGPLETNLISFRWMASDNVSSPQFADPNAIQYSYMLDGVDLDWSPWSAGIYEDYSGIPVGNYLFQVRARDTAGNISPTSQVSFQAIAENLPESPAAPTGLTASAGDAQVSLVWQASVGADSYNVKRSQISGGPYSVIAAEVADTNYIDSTVQNGTVYYYIVTATNLSTQLESVPSDEVVALPIAPSSPPISATVSNGQLRVSWPLDHLGWLLQAQTNSHSAGLSTNWTTLIGSDATNLMVLPIQRSNGSVFIRLVRP